MNRSEQRYRHRLYYARNRDRLRAYYRAYYATHPEYRADQIPGVQRRRAKRTDSA
jgi:hypothetical protein